MPFYVLSNVYINVEPLILLQIYKSNDSAGSFTSDVKKGKKESLDSFEVSEVSGYQG